MKKVLKILSINAVLYLMMVYIDLEFNPLKWCQDRRVFVCVMFPAITVIYLLMESMIIETKNIYKNK